MLWIKRHRPGPSRIFEDSRAIMSSGNQKISTRPAQVWRGEDHFEALRERISRAKGEVQLVSPWVVGDVVLQLIDSKPADVEGMVVFRWPSTDDDPALYDLDVLNKLLERSDVELCFTCEPLHAKVYSVDDDYVLITSANLTGSGFPRSTDTVGNVEIGVELQNTTGVAEAVQKLESCELHVFDSHHLSQLEDWVRKTRDWRAENAEVFDAKPDPGTPHIRLPAEMQALELAKQEGWIAGYEHISSGLRHKAYRIELGGAGNWRNVRVLRSVASAGPVKDYQTNYHFNISERDVSDWKNRREPRIHGLVLVPLTGGDAPDEWHLNRHESPIAFLPLSEIFRRTRFPVSKFLKAKHANYPGLFLSQKVDQSWVLRLPAATSDVIPVDEFLRSTRRMKSAPKNWANRK
jgi:hypothetical protein